MPCQFTEGSFLSARGFNIFNALGHRTVLLSTQLVGITSSSSFLPAIHTQRAHVTSNSKSLNENQLFEELKSYGLRVLTIFILLYF